jgi:hypothetical protein
MQDRANADVTQANWEIGYITTIVAMPSYDELVIFGELFGLCLFVLLVVAMVWSKRPPS